MSRRSCVSLVVVSMFVFVAACDECDYDGQTWCEDDVVMVCELHEGDDDYEDEEQWEEEEGDGGESVIGAVFTLIVIAIAEAFDQSDEDQYVAEELWDCGAVDQQCVERWDQEEETFAVCEY